MGTDTLLKVVQRGILLRDGDEQTEALLLENPDGTWELPGGKIGRGETAFESLQREIHEETGLRVRSAEPVETAVRKRKKKKNRGKFGVVYRCRFEGDGVDLSDEHVDFAWMTREQVTAANLAVVDEYRSLRRVLRTETVGDGSDADEVGTGVLNGERGER